MSAVQLFLSYGASGYAWGTMPTAHNSTDQLLDSQMGLLSYGARFYDPVSDQFVSADSVQGNPSGMDPYGYVGGNPETDVDPTGQKAADLCEDEPEECDSNATSEEKQGSQGSYRPPPSNSAASAEGVLGGDIPADAVVQPEVTVTTGSTTTTLDDTTNIITVETLGPDGEPQFVNLSPGDPGYDQAFQTINEADVGANEVNPEQGGFRPSTTDSASDDSSSSSGSSSSGSSADDPAIQQLDSNKPVTVIGETQTRVVAAAQEIRDAGFTVNTYDPDSNPPSMGANRAWLRYWVDKGSQIVDIGPDLNRGPARAPSVFYAMEHNSLERWEITFFEWLFPPS